MTSDAGSLFASYADRLLRRTAWERLQNAAKAGLESGQKRFPYALFARMDGSNWEQLSSTPGGL